jgi:DNA invertase Pin-like site-specific DNA recombinase
MSAPSALIGYARVSTVEQDAGFADQQHQLEGAGCSRVFREKVSAVSPQRPEFDRCLDYVREGDTLCVTRLDRLARSMADLITIVATLERKRVGLRVLSGGAAMDTSTASGRLMLQVFGAVAEFERALMLERQKAGIAAARAAGKYRGGTRRYPERIRKLAAEGLSRAAIARALGCSTVTVWRALRPQDVGTVGVAAKSRQRA